MPASSPLAARWNDNRDLAKRRSSYTDSDSSGSDVEVVDLTPEVASPLTTTREARRGSPITDPLYPTSTSTLNPSNQSRLVDENKEEAACNKAAHTPTGSASSAIGASRDWLLLDGQSVELLASVVAARFRQEEADEEAKRATQLAIDAERRQRLLAIRRAEWKQRSERWLRVVALIMLGVVIALMACKAREVGQLLQRQAQAMVAGTKWLAHRALPSTAFMAGSTEGGSHQQAN